MKIIVGITGGSGAIYALSLLKVLSDLNIETHLVVSDVGVQTVMYECGVSLDKLKAMSNFYYDNNDMFSAIASGSFKTNGMIIVPCSMKSMASIAHGFSDNLISRAADVCLKERRKLLIVPRETPLNEIHINNMLTLCRAGAMIMPACPPFYNHPVDLSDIVRSMVGRMLDLMDIENNLLNRWGCE